MNIDIYCGGAAETNSYLISDKGRGFLVDAPDGAADWLKESISKFKIKLEGLLLTHAHWDHIVDAAAIQKEFKVPVFIHRDSAVILENPQIQAAFSPHPDLQACHAEKILNKETELSVAGMEMKLLHCPGHCPGSLCFYFANDKKLFGGDVLFAGSVGRWDLPGGSQAVLMKSIFENILVLPENTEVYPGHGPSTTVGHEKKNNPYLQAVEKL